MTYLLSILTFSPLAVALILLLVRAGDRPAKVVALTVTGLLFVASLVLYISIGSQPLVEDYEWIKAFDIHMKLKADGIGAAMVVLTTFLSFVGMACSWNSIKKNVRNFYLLLLALESGMLGVFLAHDLFLFYVFWEVSLIPMYFLIGAWGGPRRLYASTKFIIFTVAGSLFMLASIIYISHTGGSFDLDTLVARGTGAGADAQELLFLAFFLAFAIKVPVFPLHTWLPDAHVEAPTAGSVILAGVLLKMGGYGLIRFAIPLFPTAAATFAFPIMVLSVAGIIYGALMALAQGDIKRLIAYSSVSHLGFVVLGIFSGSHTAMQGAIMQMVNHGLSTGALFVLVGMIYDRTHRRGIDDFGGLAATMPRYATFFLIVTLSSIGLPGLNGFVGEVLILIGTFQSQPILAAIGASGVILGAVYMLRLYRLVFFGPVTSQETTKGPDLSRWEIATLVPLILLIVALGVLPKLLILSRTDGAVRTLMEGLKQAGM